MSTQQTKQTKEKVQFPKPIAIAIIVVVLVAAVAIVLWSSVPHPQAPRPGEVIRRPMSAPTPPSAH